MSKTSEHFGLSALEKRAEIAKAVRLRNTSLTRILKDEIGISHSHFLYLMDGTRNPSQGVAEKLSKLCDMSLIEFWGRTEFHQPPKHSSLSKKTGNN